MRIALGLALGVFAFTAHAQIRVGHGGDTTHSPSWADTLAHRASADTDRIPLKAPKLACGESPASKVNYALLKVEASCLACTASTQEATGWGKTVSVTNKPGNLPYPKSIGTVGITCDKTGEAAYRVRVSANQSVLAGFNGDYMWSDNTVIGEGHTGFYVPKWTWRKHCLRVSAREGRIVATKASAGSSDFHPGTTPIDVITLIDPAGKRYEHLTPGTVIRLKPAGFWAVQVNLQHHYYSSQAENSGYFDIHDDMAFHIGGC